MMTERRVKMVCWKTTVEIALFSDVPLPVCRNRRRGQAGSADSAT